MHARHLFARSPALGAGMAGAADAGPLRVERSVTGRAWRPRLDEAGDREALAIAQLHGLPDPLARVVAGRGVTAQTCAVFLEPRLRDLLPDPSTLTAMDAAAERLASACVRGERVAIFGDYDVDGAASAALLADVLAELGAAPAIHIPDRLTEGYGPNAPAIHALADAGATLLVTVDCGTSGDEAFAAARSRGLDVVVLDHHQPSERLPDVLALVNPNRPDCLSGLGHLCAAGVVFMACVALVRALRTRGAFATRPEPRLLDALDLVGLATVADVVPLRGLNRAFVRGGLAVLARKERPGLAALLEVGRIAGAPEAHHLGYILGPRINAGGRIGDSSLGTRLLRARDPVEAARIAARLDGLNGERQAAEKSMVEDALEKAGAHLAREPDAPALVLGSSDWHPGIVGLIAARLKERHGRPAFAIAWDGEGRGVGSGRSVPGLDLGAAVRAAVAAGVVVRGGGHAMAAGVTLEQGAEAAFAAHLNASLAAQGAVPGAMPDLAYDAALGAPGCTPDLIRGLERAGPYGSGHDEPVFVLARQRVLDARPVGAAHLRLRLEGPGGHRMAGIAFKVDGTPLGDALARAPGGPILHLAGTLTLNSFQGRETVELRVVDAAPDAPGP